jgi:uncharacterized protein
MKGMNRTAGSLMSGDDHLAQSIGDILTTPLVTRVMRRDYGSLLFERLDRPLNDATRLLVIMASAMAIARWEPRIEVRRIQFDGQSSAGQGILTVIGRRTDTAPSNSLTRLTIPLT